ncbi:MULTISPECIES: NAD-dependent epimerase/dehydratase family protein [Gordonia]|uniref:Putative oxidoreductase n=1 Tax=Gordonia sputi NBRC 100414 TaxID=1089453 RepID=H5U5I3_9ACTN|nr:MULTISPECIES: NAD-dependent epimerase/dehydratase family protein [Gordonia]NKY94201.1 zinc-binding alcohol dehydrogenase family protein [Gordonia sputi]OBA37192.1 oxidoreductase [Gordonia sp. 852002-51296_SCH5728562-b]OBA59278.1 oxidoreductase [Gordonia sp. 852002-10350_SCH5691597]GAB40991.1 putative oxidoreductase [Gordonia sputi NBRC 100414]
MKAAIITEAGHNPVPGTFDEPEVVAGTQLFELVGAGLHQIVRSLAAGRHYGSSGIYPQVPGIDAVVRAADGSLRYTGRIAPPWGTMAERMAAQGGFPVPDDADPLAVAAGVNPAGSGWLPLHAHRDARGRLGTVLILGATGMSGRLAVQSARVLGADRIIAAGRNQAVLRSLRAPNVDVVELDVDDPAGALAEAVATSTPDLVLDYVWGPVAEATFTALGRQGLHEDDAQISYVQIGSLAGTHAAVPSTLLRSRNITISGSGAGSVSAEQQMRSIPAVIDAIASGALQVPYAAFGIDDVEKAWSYDGPERAVVTP